MNATRRNELARAFNMQPAELHATLAELACKIGCTADDLAACSLPMLRAIARGASLMRPPPSAAAQAAMQKRDSDNAQRRVDNARRAADALDRVISFLDRARSASVALPDQFAAATEVVAIAKSIAPPHMADTIARIDALLRRTADEPLPRIPGARIDVRG